MKHSGLESLCDSSANSLDQAGQFKKHSLNSHGKYPVKYPWNVSSRSQKLKHKEHLHNKAYNNTCFLVPALFGGSNSYHSPESSGNGCFVCQSVGWSQGIPASTPWDVPKPCSSCLVRKWLQSKSFGSQCNDGLEFFERISWIVSWKWDLGLDHSAQHPDLLSESLEWFWIYADVKRGRINPFFQHWHIMRNYQLSSLFPPISSLPHTLQTLMLYMKNRSFQMAPVGAI